MLDHEDRLGVPDVRELRRVDQVADGVHARLAGLAVLVDHDEATVVDLHTGAVEAELVGERAPTDRDDARVDLDRLTVAEVHGRAARVVGRVAGDLDAGAGSSICFFLKLRTTTLATSASRPGRIFGRPSRIVTSAPEIGERGRELAADRAAADHRDTGWHVVEIEHLVTGHDRTPAIEAGDRARHGAGGEDHRSPR